MLLLKAVLLAIIIPVTIMVLPILMTVLGLLAVAVIIYFVLLEEEKYKNLPPK